MSKTIEIKGSTLVKFASVLIGLGLMLYFLNSYDRNKKKALLKENIELLQNSKLLEEVSNSLQNQDTTILREEWFRINGKVDNLVDETTVINVYAGFTNLLFHKEGRFFMTNYRYPSDPAKKKRINFVDAYLSKKEKETIKKIAKKDTDIFQTLLEMNEEEIGKRIILPLTSSEKGDWYLRVNYYYRS